MHPLLRFTLDLFESNQPVSPVSPAKNAPKNGVKKPTLSDPIKSRPIAPTTSTQQSDGLTPANFRHPQASRELRLGDALVAYEFKRGQRRTIGFSVGPQGLAVRAPKWAPLHEVDAALHAKSAWILRKLQETRERHAKLAEQVIDWRDGASFLYLGQSVTIRLDPEHRFGSGGAQLSEDEPPLLRISLPRSASADQIRDTVQAWLMRKAKLLFAQRLDHFAPLLGVQWKKLSLSNAGTRWGSAKTDGSIRLNWRLIHFKLSVIDYVVAHELSHLRVMDHSPRFWDTVRTVLPDYAALRQQLKSSPIR
jgi:predicted metal-dependent hydrolase